MYFILVLEPVECPCPQTFLKSEFQISVTMTLFAKAFDPHPATLGMLRSLVAGDATVTSVTAIADTHSFQTKI